MQRKVKLPVAVGDTLTFRFKNGREPVHLNLREVRVESNKIEWLFLSSQRHIIYGANARHQEKFPPGFLSHEDDCWICLSIPILMHVGRDELKVEFVLNVPASVSVQRNDPCAASVKFTD